MLVAVLWVLAVALVASLVLLVVTTDKYDSMARQVSYLEGRNIRLAGRLAAAEQRLADYEQQKAGEEQEILSSLLKDIYKEYMKNNDVQLTLLPRNEEATIVERTEDYASGHVVNY